jgi:hypothetical protein
VIGVDRRVCNKTDKTLLIIIRIQYARRLGAQGRRGITPQQQLLRSNSVGVGSWHATCDCKGAPKQEALTGTIN